MCTPHRDLIQLTELAVAPEDRPDKPTKYDTRPGSTDLRTCCEASGFNSVDPEREKEYSRLLNYDERS